MGQRHQIYLRLAKVFYNEKNPNNRPELTVGMHNQWLYGHSAVSSLYRFLKFLDATKGDEYSPMKDSNGDTALAVLDNAYSIDIETGYHSGNHRFPINPKDKDYEHCCEDPRKGDNNNGITIIDVADIQKPKYCFMSIGHLECLDSSMDVEPDSDKPTFVNFHPISVEHWMNLHFGVGWQSKFLKEEGMSYVLDRVAFVAKHETLSTKRLIEIFPKLKTDLLQGAKDAERMTPSSVKLIRELAAKPKRK